MATAIGLGLILLQQPLIRIGLSLMGASEDVTRLASEYASIRIWSAPAVLCKYTLVGWLIGTQYPRGPMLMLILANSLNMVLDILFVTVWGWNSQGVAVATVMAEYSATGLGLWLVWRRRPLDLRFDRQLLGVIADYLAILQVNRYILVRTVLLLLSIAFFTAQGAQQGDTVLAANAVLITFLMLISNGLDGFANAAEALVGEAIGQRHREQFGEVCRTALRWSLWGALLFTFIFVVGGDHQPVDQHSGGGCHRQGLYTLDLGHAVRSRLGLSAGWHLYWRHPHPRHAEHHAACHHRRVFARLVAHPELGQSWALVCDAEPDAGPGSRHGLAVLPPQPSRSLVHPEQSHYRN